jgi:CII-binding regulator of phage lambda lysogenization HflD
MWKREIKNLNDKIFKLEQDKKNKIYSHKRDILRIKLEVLNQKLERKLNIRPNEKQRFTIENLKDKTKKKEKLDNLKKLEEEISFIKQDITKLKKSLDDLSFEFEDLKNEMNKKNLAKFYTNILGLAIIQFTD